MSEETVQEVQELATVSQEVEPSISPDVGEAIAESKKYRTRAQSAEKKAESLQNEIKEIRTKQLEEQNDYKTLADERKAIIDEQNAELETTRAEIKAEVESLLSDFSDDDRETFNGLPLKQLRAVHHKVIMKPNPVSIDNSKPSSMGGYSSFPEWATADPEGYKKANNPQTSGKIKVGYGN
jgi:dsDNA-specific endonuclease/ATPase MutS2